MEPETMKDNPLTSLLWDTINKKEYSITNDFLINEQRKVSILNKIPRFVESENYASAFGAQWKQYRVTQLDSYTGQPITEKRMRRCFGELFDRLAGKTVLEAGCGAGRFTEILLKQGARVVSVDLSEAVDANKENFPITNDHMIVQADICQLPFKESQFDIVMCLGVIQHTPDPEKTIHALYSHVKPGGLLVIDHYTHTLSYYTKTTPLIRFFLKRLAAGKGLRITEKIVKYVYPLHRFAKNNYPLQALLSRISPAHSYFHAYPELSDKVQYEWMLLDTHDSLTDYFKHFRTKKKISKFLNKLGAKNIWAAYGGNGVEARCTKPNS
jgi:2-polyprenyl-3-methyl-5-hydroxy-6-metoxy-1,4-benzoquinol methylase